MSKNIAVTITKKEYDRLVEESDMLNDLRDAGVDNWDGYSEAMRIYREEYSKAE